MATLLIRLCGPMQSWGTTSRFDERDTQLEPSKSAVIGLVCAAMGRDRSEPLDDLAALRMGVRVDREGTLMRDFQTAKGVMTASGKTDANRTVVSPRYYLADAAFLVGLEGDMSLLRCIEVALQSPHWPLCLGRKSFPPGLPVFLPDGLREYSLRDALCNYPRLVQPRSIDDEEKVRLHLEDASEGVLRMDQPLGTFGNRNFGPRYICSEVIDVPVSTTD